MVDVIFRDAHEALDEISLLLVLLLPLLTLIHYLVEGYQACSTPKPAEEEDDSKTAVKAEALHQWMDVSAATPAKADKEEERLKAYEQKPGKGSGIGRGWNTESAVLPKGIRTPLDSTLRLHEAFWIWAAGGVPPGR